MKIALFAGSFDPFTRGHAAIVEESLMLFDSVVVGIGVNSEKRGFLDAETRKRLIEDYYRDQPRVKVEIYSSLTADFAKQIGAAAMVRGVRTFADFEYERSIDTVNRELSSYVPTVILLTPPTVSHISSSVVRELLRYGKRVDEYLPQAIDINEYL